MLFCHQSGYAGDGPLGIDHRLSYDNSGIWSRSNQKALRNAMIVTVAAGCLWEGGETRLGKTFWQSLDASLLAGGGASAMKRVFARKRPRDENDPDEWFQRRSYSSFPSGEVALTSAFVTPFVLEYHHEHPLVYGLELLPVYDGIARMKVHAHWQTDVLAGFALGALAGYYAHSREIPLTLVILPGRFAMGLKVYF